MGLATASVAGSNDTGSGQAARPPDQTAVIFPATAQPPPVEHVAADPASKAERRPADRTADPDNRRVLMLMLLGRAAALGPFGRLGQ